MSQRKPGQSKQSSTTQRNVTRKAVGGRSATTGPTSPRPWLLGAIGVVLLAVGVLVGWLAFGGSGSGSADAHDVAAVDEDYQRRALEALTDLVTSSYPKLVDVLMDLNRAMPVEQGAEAVPLTTDELDELAATLDEISEDFSALAGGESDYNVARNGFALGVNLLGDCVDLLAEVGETGGDTDLAATLRYRAIDAWSNASTQFDLLSVAMSGEHLHVTLPIAPLGDEAPAVGGDH